MDWQKRNFWFFVFDKGSSGPKWSGKLFDWKLTFANSRSLFIFFTVHTNLWSLKKKKNIYSLVRTNKNKKNLLVRTVQHPRRSTVGGTSLCYILIGRGKSVSHLISWSVVMFHKGSGQKLDRVPIWLFFQQQVGWGTRLPKTNSGIFQE